METSAQGRVTTPVGDQQALMTTMQSFQNATVAAQNAAREEQRMANQGLMDNMAKMFNMTRDDQLQREEKLHDKLVKLDKQQVTVTTQVDHLTSTVRSFRDQLDTNADFAVDAMQQMRGETDAKLKAMEQTLMAALNAGGDRASSSHQAPATDDKSFNLGKPDVKDESTNAQYSTQCSYCDGFVPKVIATHCTDCDLHFHPGHYQKHRDEWPCPMVGHDLCPWCADHIQESDEVTTCEVCQYMLHNACYAKDCPCPDG